MIIVTEESVEKALDFMLANARKAAEAIATRQYLEDYKSSLRSMIMIENKTETLGAQEARALADERYKTHLEALKIAIGEEQYLRFMMKAAETKIDVWRTQSSNERSARI